MPGWNLTGTAPRAQGASEGDEALSVSQAVEMAASALDALPLLTVIGEVTGFRGPNARSGHCYFQIKDDACAVDCIIWRGSYAKRSFELRDGMQVQFTGNFNLYKATGRMSFVAKSFTLAGEGLLRQQVAALAEKLRLEGLCDDARKRRIPVFCTRVAVVTSLSGAVIDDVKRTLRRRNPLVELICVGAKVQGDGAPAELIEGLARAAAIDPAPDCILLVRGGGSFEDLMTFNDEALARAVASCPVPVVTGIGHEPDTSICDMVSDRRCSTPTAAAESVAPAMSDLVDVLDARERRMVTALTGTVRAASSDVAALRERADRAFGGYMSRLAMALDAAAARPCLRDPAWMVDRRLADLEQSADRLGGAAAHAQERFEAALARLAPRLSATASSFAVREHELALASSRLGNEGRALLSDLRSELGARAASLDALSPLKVLARGYSIAYGPSGVVTSAADVKPDDELRIRLADGDVRARALSVEKDNGDARPCATRDWR
ncbi:exodeoxyribonuclease VII large subunit [Collinsella sp. An271]|uniref:exodeoxyribonuclease VII large subunit n=1 Tax=Collinsella sp. An271 TaxID=1965616 RepID=UPI000B393F59|nr:exodeoxyribonuclease VII large subunit [Collinsella sp. An271]OUO62025.1 exodeoxyribonuclease VII large subunit [Collinsella sp. An271]